MGVPEYKQAHCLQKKKKRLEDLMRTTAWDLTDGQERWGVEKVSAESRSKPLLSAVHRACVYTPSLTPREGAGACGSSLNHVLKASCPGSEYEALHCPSTV